MVGKKNLLRLPLNLTWPHVNPNIENAIKNIFKECNQSKNPLRGRLVHPEKTPHKSQSLHI